MAPCGRLPPFFEGGRRQRPRKARSAAAAGCGALRCAEAEAGFGRVAPACRGRSNRGEVCIPAI